MSKVPEVVHRGPCHLQHLKQAVERDLLFFLLIGAVICRRLGFPWHSEGDCAPPEAHCSRRRWRRERCSHRQKHDQQLEDPHDDDAQIPPSLEKRSPLCFERFVCLGAWSAFGLRPPPFNPCSSLQRKTARRGSGFVQRRHTCTIDMSTRAEKGRSRAVRDDSACRHVIRAA